MSPFKCQLEATASPIEEREREGERGRERETGRERERGRESEREIDEVLVERLLIHNTLF